MCARSAFLPCLIVLLLSVDKQVFPSLEFIGWYTVASVPTARHIALHEQVRLVDFSSVLHGHHIHYLKLCAVHSLQLYATPPTPPTLSHRHQRLFRQLISTPPPQSLRTVHRDKGQIIAVCLYRGPVQRRDW